MTDLETPCHISEKINITREYRCVIVDRKIITISPYIDYYNKLNSEYRNDCKIILKNDFNLPYNLFPRIFIMDVLFDDKNRLDIVEFNEFCSSGRYMLNKLEPFIELIRFPKQN